MISISQPMPSVMGHKGLWRRLLADQANRVGLLISLIWLANLIDLFFTLLAATTGVFVEMNPLAAPLSSVQRICFKFAVLVFFTVIAVCLRRRRTMELGCCVLLGVYTVLAAIWFSNFGFLLSPYFLKQLVLSLT
jgi:hypothetical protein